MTVNQSKELSSVKSNFSCKQVYNAVEKVENDFAKAVKFLAKIFDTKSFCSSNKINKVVLSKSRCLSNKKKSPCLAP